MKRALIVGIDDYAKMPLSGCVNDAVSIAQMLERNGDGAPNFSIRLLSSNEDVVSTENFSTAVTELFAGDAETVLLFFAGHGMLNPDTNAGFLVTQDANVGAWGVSLADVLGLANRAYPKIKSTVIILDSCHSGYAGEQPTITNATIIGSGVTILTACNREGYAAEKADRGVFTDMLLDGLAGSAADICGNVTPASLYAHVDQTLGPWEQRPVYKANVQTFVTLRQVSPKISLDTLRRLPKYFPDPAYLFPLDPSFEPDRVNVPKEVAQVPANSDNARVFKELQACNRHGLVVPVDAEHMYYAAINSTSCRLTALGAHYRKLAAMGRL